MRSSAKQLLIIVAISMPFLFWGIASIDFLDPDEGMYGAIAREMVEGGDWVIPHFNGLPYLEKPPLYLWLSASMVWLSGPSEWAVRFWSSLPALATAVLIWRAGKLIYGDRAGFMSAVVFLSSVGVFHFVRVASTDFLFIFCLTLSMYGVVGTLTCANGESQTANAGTDRLRWTRYSLFFWFGMALGLLAKGLIGVVFPLLIVGLNAVVSGQWRAASSLTNRYGIALFLAVAAPWHVIAAWQDPGLFRFYLVDNQILRFLNLRAFVEDDIPVSTTAFLLLSFIWFFPWGVFLFAHRSTETPAAAGLRSIPVIWAVVVFGFFMLSRSKLEYYALPAFPALALLAGSAWATGRNIGRWLWIGLAGCAAVGLMALRIGSGLTPDQALNGLAELIVYYRILRDQGLPFPFPSALPFGLALQGLGLALLVGWGHATVFWVKQWRQASFWALVGTAGIIGGLVINLLHVVEPHHSAKAVSQAITARGGSDELIVHEGSLEYSAALPFYTGRRVAVLDGAKGDLDYASRLPEGEGWFVDATQFEKLWQGPDKILIVTQLPWERSALASLPPQSVRWVGQYGSRRLYANHGSSEYSKVHSPRQRVTNWQSGERVSSCCF
jgi:4-amino-4-deoxy-L-arabinose transferase-like glycosyltransferase